MAVQFKRVYIIGIGLIGGSLGLAINNRQLAEEVVGFDLNPENTTLALATGAIHAHAQTLAEGAQGADLVILATPVGSYPALLQELAPHLAPTTIVTDVGSTKERVVQEAELLLPPTVAFVGGHPMAGSEQIGMQGADAYLFENAVYLLTPTATTNQQALAKVTALCTGIGSRVFNFSPAEHDLMVAAVSHLPHLLAATLTNTVGQVQEAHPSTLLLAAGGFRDTTRIAMGSPDMWRDVFLANRKHLLAIIQQYKATLTQLETQISQGEAETIYQALDKARNLRLQVPTKLKGYWPQLFEIVITVPDQPGMIAQVAAILAEEQINIADIEILRVREGEGGTIRLGFTTPGSDQAAIAVLRSRGIVAKLRS